MTDLIEHLRGLVGGLSDDYQSRLETVPHLDIENAESIRVADEWVRTNLPERLVASLDAFQPMDNPLRGVILLHMIETTRARYLGIVHAYDALKDFNDLPDEYSGNSISRAIEFPPEFRQAGISVLAHFQEILESRNPESVAKFSIEREGNSIRLVIDTPTGEKEYIEETLKKYGQVVLGKKPAEEFANSERELLELRGVLRTAETQIANQRDIIDVYKRNDLEREKRLERIEEQNALFASMLGGALSRGQDITQATSENAAEQIKAALDLLGKKEQNLLDIVRMAHIEKISAQKLSLALIKLAHGLSETDQAHFKIIVDALTAAPDEAPSESEIKASFEILKAEEPGLLRKAGNLLTSGLIETGVLQGLNGNMAFKLLMGFMGMGG